MSPRTVMVLICAAGVAAVQAQVKRPANPLSTVLRGHTTG